MRRRRARKTPVAPAKPEEFEIGWRVMLFVLGVFFLIAATKVWFDPPTKAEFAPQATLVSEKADVPDRSETVAALLVGLGVLVIVIAANGRKLTSVEIAGSKFSTDDVKAAGEAKGQAKTLALMGGIDPDEAERLGEVAEAKVFTKVATAETEWVNHDEIVANAVSETVPPPAS
jgi:hypothetical protein